MTLIISILFYAIVMTLANLLIAEFGQVVIPFNAFVLIGLDLTLRDWLHDRIKPWQMGLLIVASGVLTYALNPAAGKFAVASACAFGAASFADWAVFSAMRGRWIVRANGSNLVGAMVDSLVFPAMAFGGLDPKIVAQMFAAKVAGGAAWSWFINRHVKS